jgi:hypothetical protein
LEVIHAFTVFKALASGAIGRPERRQTLLRRGVVSSYFSLLFGNLG